MIKHSDGLAYIDLNLVNSNTEIPLSSLQLERESLHGKNAKFTFEEVDVNESSAGVYFTQHGNTVLVSVFGPREVKFRDKAKINEAIVDIYTKFNYETQREKTKKINSLIQNFCESIILLDAYPRCQINIHLNVISIKDESSLVTTLLNGIMFALCISGLDLKLFALTTSFSLPDGVLIVSLDANKPEKVVLIESNVPLKVNEYSNYIEISKEEVSELFKRFKSVLLKKII